MILKNKSRVLVLAAVIALFGVRTAYATPTITSPYVTKDRTAVELKSSYDFDDEDAWETEASISHGFTDYWVSELSVEGSGAEDEDNEFSSVNWENKFQLAPKGELFVDPGLKVEYSHSLNGEPDEVQFKFLMAKTLGKFNNAANINISHEVGEDSEDGFGYGLSYGLAYEVSEDFSFGAEWFSDFGDFAQDFHDQGHEIGPVAYGIIPGGLKYETGILFGLSDSSPDATAKLVLQYAF